MDGGRRRAAVASRRRRVGTILRCLRHSRRRSDARSRRDEDQRGKEKVAVISHRLWLNLFGGDRTIVGRNILLNGEPYTVIGVLPGNSEFDRRSSELWVPLAFPPQVARDYHYLSAVARLKRGVSFQQAQAEMSAIADGIATRYPAIKKDWGATVDRYLDRVVGPQMRLSLIVLMSAVVAVLLIGCANLANLLMARATLRSREIALRAGARRPPRTGHSHAADREPLLSSARRCRRRRSSATVCCAGFRACCRRSIFLPRPASPWTAACCSS